VEKIKWLHQIQLSDYDSVGDQALALSYLIKNNYPVVNGFVITSEITRDFFAQLEIDFQSLNIDNYQNLQKFAQDNYHLIINHILPSNWEFCLTNEVKKLNTKVISLSYSLVEINPKYQNLSSLLNSEIISINPENIVTDIKKIWANLFNAKILFYCQKIGIKFEDINLSIIVQSLDDIFASGLIKISNDLITVKSSYGLVDSILKGEVLPDIYEINGQSGDILKQQLGKKNISYRINQDQFLEKFIVDEVKQNEFTLSKDILKKLINLTQDICKNLDTFDYCEWMILNNNRDKIYLNKLTQLNKSSQNKLIKTVKKEPLLSGLGVSNGKVHGNIQVISGFNYHFQSMKSGTILVTKNITPDWLPLLKKTAGIITEQGGTTSHVAIIARELGIPAIVKAKNATKLLKSGELIVLDGNSGEVYADFQGAEKEVKLFNKNKLQASKNLVNFSTELKTKLLVNLSEVSLIDSAISLPVDGIGLIRADLILLDLVSDSSFTFRQWLDNEHRLILLDKWTNLIIKFAKSFAPKPIFYRSLDWLNVNNLTEINSLSSQRGTLAYFLEDSLFELELEILARVQTAGYTNINLILPFVRSVDEFIFCRNLVTKMGLNRYKSFRLLIMAEVPSVLFLLPEYIKLGVQGITIGTNDLTQLLLGIDRHQDLDNFGLNAIHPAVLKAIENLVKIAHEGEIFTCICGQAPTEYPELIDSLVRWGIDAISVDLNAVEKTYQAIALAENKYAASSLVAKGD
jgi:pyruvate,water dikinase